MIRRLQISIALLLAIAALALPRAVRAAPHRPACTPALVESPKGLLVKVAGRDLFLAPAIAPSPELRVYPATADAVFVAYAGRGEHGPYGSDTLWRISCNSGEPQVVARIDDADFGHAALSKNRRTLFFTGADGVFALDLATLQARRLTKAVRDACQKNQVPARDVVGDFLDARTLAMERGCGYGHEWNGLPMLLRDPGSPRMSVANAPRAAPSSVAISTDGQLWLADGNCKDRATQARVMVSSDRGDHWRALPVKMPTPQPVRLVITDRFKRGAVLIVTASCESNGHVAPGWIYLTTNAGRTFRAFTAPAGIPSDAPGEPTDEQDPIEAVTTTDGSLTRVVLYGRSEQVAANLTARWETRDGGRTWTDLPPVAAAPRMTPPTIAIGDGELTLRKDGLYRARRGERPARIYPRD